MKFCSTNNPGQLVDLKEAIVKGLADDNGLFMPQVIPTLPQAFWDNLHNLSFQEIGWEVSKVFFGSDVEANALEKIVFDALDFEVPLVPVTENIHCLELFHGPTLAFKDFGARFMARLLGYFTRDMDQEIHVLVATSGDTGSAVANGFLGVKGVRVHVLYPSGLVSNLQEKQFATLGKNITALEIDGTFDDCQHLVKKAFLDKELKGRLLLTSANSINLGRLIPQAFYYIQGYAKMPSKEKVVVSVPSGNFGNLTAGLIAKRMGLPVHRFISATNLNDIVPAFLETGEFLPRASVATIANAMDVGNPSNFARMLSIYNNSRDAMAEDIQGYRFADKEIRQTIERVYKQTGYLTDPHGAVGYQALEDYLSVHGGQGFFLETAHPAKFLDTVEEVIGEKVEIPERLQYFASREKVSLSMSNRYEDFQVYLLGL